MRKKARRLLKKVRVAQRESTRWTDTRGEPTG